MGTVVSKSNEEARYLNEEGWSGDGDEVKADGAIGGGRNGKDDDVTKEDEELAFGGLVNNKKNRSQKHKKNMKEKEKEKMTGGGEKGKHEVLREKHGPRASLKSVEDGLLEGEEKGGAKVKKVQKGN